MVRLSTLTTIIRQAEEIDYMRPKAQKGLLIFRELEHMTPERLGELFRAIDSLILNCKLLGHEIVELDDRGDQS